MHRKEFIKTCAFACTTLSGLSILLSACSHTKTITAPIENSTITIHSDAFIYTYKNESRFRKGLIITNEKLRYPICLFRYNDTHFKAFVMRCPHQGVELQLYGDKLVCSAHGSEFDNLGHVISPPADKDLRELHCTFDQAKIIINLL